MTKERRTSLLAALIIAVGITATASSTWSPWALARVPGMVGQRISYISAIDLEDSGRATYWASNVLFWTAVLYGAISLTRGQFRDRGVATGRHRPDGRWLGVMFLGIFLIFLGAMKLRNATLQTILLKPVEVLVNGYGAHQADLVALLGMAFWTVLSYGVLWLARVYAPKSA